MTFTRSGFGLNVCANAVGLTSGMFGRRAGKGAEKMAKALRHLQAHLGEVTDMDSHLKIINHLMKKAGQRPMPRPSARASSARLWTRLVGHQARWRERLEGGRCLWRVRSRQTALDQTLSLTCRLVTELHDVLDVGQRYHCKLG